MSLKAFHLFFIGVSVLTCFGFAVWAFQDYARAHNPLYLLLGMASGVGGVLLSVYLLGAGARLKRMQGSA